MGDNNYHQLAALMVKGRMGGVMSRKGDRVVVGREINSASILWQSDC